MDNIDVTKSRQMFGKLLAQRDINKFNKNDYIVVGCPESGIISGQSYAYFLDLPYKQVITKNQNVNTKSFSPLFSFLTFWLRIIIKISPS